LAGSPSIGAHNIGRYGGPFHFDFALFILILKA
jgi:hypothetical protein